MAQDVGQGLLHHPVGDGVDLRRQGEVGALDLQVDRQATGLDVVDQGGQTAKAELVADPRGLGGGRGDGRGRLGRVEGVQGGPQLGQGRCAGLPDRFQGVAGLVGSLLQYQQGHPGLHGNRCEPVPGHVVDFLGDPHPLLQRRPGHKVVSCPLGGVVDRTWTSAPSDQGTTSQLVHPSNRTAGRWSASRTRRVRAKATATAAASPHASSDVRTRWRRATSNIATTMHSWMGP